MKDKIFIAIFCLLLVSYASAQNDQYSAAQVAFCPRAQDLVRAGLWWHTNDKVWKSDSQSFAKKVKTFAGAQWQGIGVGKIICLYQGEQNLTFPISLQPVHAMLVESPTKGVWSKDKGGFKNCKSDNIADCPFIEKKHVKVQDVFEQLRYKGPITDNN